MNEVHHREVHYKKFLDQYQYQGTSITAFYREKRGQKSHEREIQFQKFPKTLLFILQEFIILSFFTFNRAHLTKFIF